MLEPMKMSYTKLLAGPCGRILVLMMPMICTASALAVNPNAPDAPSLRRFPLPAWLGFMIMFVLVAIVISISLMPSKRSHQD